MANGGFVRPLARARLTRQNNVAQYAVSNSHECAQPCRRPV